MHSTLLSEKTSLRNASIDLSVGLINQNWVSHPCLNQSLSRRVRHHDWLTPVLIHPWKLTFSIGETEGPNKHLVCHQERRGLPVKDIINNICNNLLSNLLSCLIILWFPSFKYYNHTKSLRILLIVDMLTHAKMHLQR